MIGVSSLKSCSSTSDASLHSCLPSKRATSIVSRNAARVSTWLISKSNVILSKASEKTVQFKKSYRVSISNTYEESLLCFRMEIKKLNESPKGDKSGCDLRSI